MILMAFHLGLQRYPGNLEAAQTIAFVTLCTSELLRAFTARSEYNSIFAIGVFSNRWMLWAVAASFLLVLMVVYVPFLNPFFDTVPLTLDDWLFMVPFFFASPIAMELVKVYFRRRTARRRWLLEAGPSSWGRPSQATRHRTAAGPPPRGLSQASGARIA